MAQGSGKNQDSTGLVLSPNYTVTFKVQGLGELKTALSCPEIVSMKTDAARDEAKRHAAKELAAQYKGKQIKVRSVQLS